MIFTFSEKDNVISIFNACSAMLWRGENYELDHSSPLTSSWPPLHSLHYPQVKIFGCSC